MQNSHFRKKYLSFVFSSVLHALILFLLFYTKMHQTAQPLYPAHRQPAQVSLVTHAPRPIKAQPTVKPTPSTASAAQIPHPLKKEPTEPAQEVPQILAQRETPQGTHSSSVSAGQFIKAFKDAIQDTKKDGQRPLSKSGQAFALERLQQWNQHHYRDRIVKELRKATRLRARTLHNTQSIDRVIHLTIPIEKSGALGDMSQYPLSEIPEVDRYILDVLRNADFPPIPKRYNTDTFLFKIPMRIKLHKGTGEYILSAS